MVKLIVCSQETELPKVLFSLRKRYALREFLLFHFLPVALTFSVFGLYLGGVTWQPPWPGTTVLNLLQVAAKIHETLIVASLATISFHHIRYRLLSSSKPDGLRLGFLTAPFQMSSPIYLFSKEFVSTFARIKPSAPKDIVTIVLHIFLVALAAVTGPSTAIAILPKLNWWPGPTDVLADGMTNLYPLETLGAGELYLGSSVEDLYLTVIDRPFLADRCSISDTLTPLGDKCPFSVFRELLETWPDKIQTLPQSRDDAFNITVQTQEVANTASRPRTVYAKLPGPLDFLEPTQFGPEVQGYNYSESVAYATTPLDNVNVGATILKIKTIPLLKSKSYDWPIKVASQAQDTTGSHIWKQPASLVHCASVSSTINRGRLGADSPVFFQYPSVLDQPVTVKLKFLPTNWTVSTVSKDVEIAFVLPEALDIDPPLYMSAAFVARPHFPSGKGGTLCLISAKWVESDVSVSVSQSHGPPDFALREPDLFRAPGHPLTFGAEWLDSLHLPIGAGKNETFFADIARDCTMEAEPAQCLALGLALGIADSLARVPQYRSGNYGLFAHISNRTVDADGFTMVGSTNRVASGIFRHGPGACLAPYAEVTARNQTCQPVADGARPDNATRVAYDVAQNVYAYGLNDVTIDLAFAVLFLHAATVAAHMLIVLCGKRWNSRAWSSLGELLNLALHSPPAPLLAHTGAGTKASATWRLRAAVEELPGENRVALTIREEAAGGVDGDKATPRSLPRADWKYS